MTKLSWGAPGERIYENGIDRGVLFVDDAGYAWSGLISVEEKSSGGELTEFFQDGIKYAEVASTENYEAIIEAYNSPSAFADCDGTTMYFQGLFLTRQKRKRFGFSYRTRVGNDTDGIEHGYKIHIVYNCRASAPDKKYETINTNDPATFSWDITAIPVESYGIRPTAHFIIDSTKAEATAIELLENYLYGTATEAPFLPTIEQLVALFSTGATFAVVDNGDGSFTMTGPESWFDQINSTTYNITAPTIEIIDTDTFTISSW